jgi:DNA-binding NarL/FixJ family response regulator
MNNVLRDSCIPAEGIIVSSMPVVLLSNRSLLVAGIEQLLRRMDGVQLSVVEATGSCAIARLRTFKPEVIVFDSGDSSHGDGVITRLLGQHPEASVVALGLDPAGIQIYTVHRVAETNLNGLKEAILGGPPALT